MKPRLAYLCLQVTRQGQASYAHVHEIMKGLRHMGWDVELFQPAFSASSRRRSSAGRLLRFAGVQLHLLRCLASFDLLYVRSHVLTLPLVVSARLKGLPVVQEVNGPYEDLFVAYPWTRAFAALLRTSMRLCLRMATLVIVVTPQLREFFAKDLGGKKPICVITNAANTELFRPEAAGIVQVSKPYVLFFGSLAAYQGIDTMLQATRLPEWPGSVKLVVAGEGAEREKVESAEREGKVSYLGAVAYEQMPGVIAGSLAGLSPQTNLHGRAATGLFPLKVFETLACGVPVVVTEFPGQADLIRETGAGLVIPPEDPRALAKAVRELYWNPGVRQAMGQRGRIAIEKQHSWSRRAERTNELLRSLLNEGGQGG